MWPTYTHTFSEQEEEELEEGNRAKEWKNETKTGICEKDSLAAGQMLGLYENEMYDLFSSVWLDACPLYIH